MAFVTDISIKLTVLFSLCLGKTRKIWRGLRGDNREAWAFLTGKNIVPSSTYALSLPKVIDPDLVAVSPYGRGRDGKPGRMALANTRLTLAPLASLARGTPAPRKQATARPTSVRGMRELWSKQSKPKIAYYAIYPRKG